MTTSAPSMRRAAAFHPRLASVFAGLESASIRWALLRMPGHPEAPTGDVDLLVHPEDAAAVATVLQPLGFAPLPGRVAAPELAFVCFDRDSATWLVLDIITEMSFGPDLRFRVTGAAEVLGRSRAVAGARVLEPDDQFWTLLLHCLLEKDFVTDRHRATLQYLAGYADPEGALGAAVARSCPPGLEPRLIISAVAAGQWEELAEIREPLRRAWLRANLGDVIRARRLRMRRVLHGPKTLVKRSGISVVLLGANGAGKSTVAEAVLRAYPDPAHLSYLGLWKQERPTGRIRGALRVLVRPALVWSRYTTSLVHRVRGELVLFDRYVYDAFLPPQPPLAWLKKPYLWVLAHSCPAPTLTVILDVPGKIAWQRKGENSVAESERERREILALRHRLSRVHVIDATQPLDDVVADVTALVWARYARRWLRPEQPPAF
jgi:thymidylate kinase